jgi:hypothetical protein
MKFDFGISRHFLIRFWGLEIRRSNFLIGSDHFSRGPSLLFYFVPELVRSRLRRLVLDHERRHAGFLRLCILRDGLADLDGAQRRNGCIVVRAGLLGVALELFDQPLDCLGWIDRLVLGLRREFPEWRVESFAEQRLFAFDVVHALGVERDRPEMLEPRADGVGARHVGKARDELRRDLYVTVLANVLEHAARQLVRFGLERVALLEKGDARRVDLRSGLVELEFGHSYLAGLQGP